MQTPVNIIPSEVVNYVTWYINLLNSCECCSLLAYIQLCSQSEFGFKTQCYQIIYFEYTCNKLVFCSKLCFQMVFKKKTSLKAYLMFRKINI